MATVTMDSSEWESMKKNIQLLEESKAREQQLNNEIKKLQDEKMEVLKSNEKNVTIVKRTDKYEVVYNTKPIRDIFTEVYTRLEQARRLGRPIESVVDGDQLIRMFFEKSVANSIGVDETITTRGFDEVKSEYEAKYKEELEQETKDSLATIPTLEKKVKELKLEIEKTGPERKQLQDDNFDLMKKNMDLTKQIDKLEKHLFSTRTDLASIIDTTWNVFNYSEMKNKLRTLLWSSEKI